MGFLITLLRGLFSAWLWIRGNKDQQIGQLKQENADAQRTIKVADDAAKIRDDVQGLPDSDLDDRLSKRVRDQLHGN